MKHGRELRKKGALERLENQLKTGVKTEKKGTNKIPLTEKDKKRIEKEIQSLKK